GVVLAAGKGERARQYKQFTMVGGQLLCCYAMNNMTDSGVFHEIIEVTPRVCGLPLNDNHRRIIGGPTRIESLYNGVMACEGDYVIFTDAARPYTPPWVFSKIANILQRNNAVVVVQPEYDSIIKARDRDWDACFHDGVLDDYRQSWENYPRDFIRRIQTPNGFKTAILIDILEDMIDKNKTNDSAISEYIRRFGKPAFLTDEFFNDKVTTAADLRHAKVYFS
ncbi:MAG: NTP transferase domain-containing protein, partial [FCB group bacterium]|nr:NTP transferase domain-containing protein [FCB group bacterium]